MIPWRLLDSVLVPGDGAELCLHQRGEEFSITVDGYELMNSRVHNSEEVLAEVTCEKIADRRKPRILIGGLGMGYTLASALKHLPSDAEIVMAELVPAVVNWNRELLGELAGFPLTDRRVKVREEDVANVMEEEYKAFDAIILDVDNGPEGLTSAENNWLYKISGLSVAYESLKPEGILAVWSAFKNNAFTRRLKRVGFQVEEVQTRSRSAKKGDRHTIWLGKKGR